MKAPIRILGLDIGSSAVKAGVCDSRGRTLSRARVGFATDFDGPRAEIPADRLWRAVRRAGRDAIAAARGADAIAFCTFSSGVVITDREGAPRTPIITHADRRSAETARQLVAGRRPNSREDWWLHRIGNLPYAGGIGASTLAWLRENQSALFRRKYRAGQVSSLIGLRLTGRWVIDPSQAAFLGLWDFRRLRWHPKVCRALGIDPDSLPTLQWADQIIGGLLPGIAREWSLPAGTPVIGGLIDTSAAVLQTPMSPGQFVHNAGSTDVLAICLRSPQPAAGILTRPVGVGRVYPQRWLAVRTIGASGSALQWARATLFPGLSDRAWRRLVEGACERDGRQELTVTCDPTFAGERAAIGAPIGAGFRGIRLGTTREDILAALIRALVTRSAANFALLRRFHKPQPRVYTMGGASDLGDAMHRAWARIPGRRFVPLPGDSLPGLAHLALRTLGA